MRWLARTGLLGDEAAVAKKSFVALCPALATGVALCDLVTAIEGVPVVGVFRNPKSVATAEANARRACERLARHKNMSRRFLFRAADVAAGVVGVLLGLLEDVRVFHDGHPPRVDGSKKWDPRVPYCPEEDFGLKGFGLKGARATGGGDFASAPARAIDLPVSPARRLRSLGRFSHVTSEKNDATSSERARSDDGSSGDDGASLVDASGGGSRAPDSAEPSPVAGGPVRVAASVDQTASVSETTRVTHRETHRETQRETHRETRDDAYAENKHPQTSPRLADAPEAAARAAAAALEGWRAGVARDLRADDASGFPGFEPSVGFGADHEPTNRAGAESHGRAHTWASGSFPRTRATPAERERRERAASAARAARVVADAYAKEKKEKPSPTGGFEAAVRPASAPRELSTAARARAAERARKEAAAAHAAAEKKTRVLDVRVSAESSRTRPTASRASRSSASFEPETVSKPGRRPPRPPAGSSFSFSRENEPPSSARPSPPRSPRPGTSGTKKAEASPNAARRPVRFVPAPSPEARRREARERDATVAARWIESLGVSLRRAGASGASALAGTKADDKKRDSCRDRDRDPFADATRTNAAELAAVCADGTLLCELVRVLEKKELAGVTWRPASNASRTHNVGKALAAMRRQPAMSPMHLWCEKDVVAADEETVLGLLGDMRACAAYKRAGRR